jgi:hypothetical protein
MKLSLRLIINVLNFLILGAIFVRPDFSLPISVSRLILNWLVRLLIAVGFSVASLLLSHVLKSSEVDSYQLIDRVNPDSNLGSGYAETDSFKQIPPRKSWSSLWSPRNLIFIVYCFAVLSLVFHLVILCKIIFVAVAVFLWMPNPWQASADQPEIYEIAPRRVSR